MLSVRPAVFALSELCQTPYASAATSGVIFHRRSLTHRAVRTLLAIMLPEPNSQTVTRCTVVVAERRRRGGWTPARLAFPAIVKRGQGAITMFDWLVSSGVVETQA